MTAVVVDASVAVKWLVPEVHSAFAEVLLDGNYELRVPDLIFVECGNVVWKKVRRGELSLQSASRILGHLAAAPLTVVPAVQLLDAALTIALNHGRTVYDSVYVALAAASGCQLVTADERLVHSLASGPLSEHVRSLASLGSKPS